MQQILDFIPAGDSLKHKVILVTGAGDGIGKQAALNYAKHGATLILLGRTVKKLESVYDEILALGGPEPAIIPLNLNGATPQHYKDMAMTIEQQFKKLDGVLFNAGFLGYLSPMEQVGDKLWNEVMQVNLNSMFFMLKPLLTVLKNAPLASVVFTSSGVGRKGRAFWGPYAVSKFATEGFMQTLADEYQDSTLRFNCINPGATRTQMRAKAYPAEDSSKLKTAAEIMPTYLYLMDDSSKAVNGLSIDAQVK